MLICLPSYSPKINTAMFQLHLFKILYEYAYLLVYKCVYMCICDLNTHTHTHVKVHTAFFHLMAFLGYLSNIIRTQEFTSFLVTTVECYINA